MSTTADSLAWTGERMVPFASDYATQATHWQRYLFFRPWYEDAHVIDAACGEGYGVNFASIFASRAEGYDLSDEAVAHAAKCYEHVSFSAADCCNVDYSKADLVTSFETIEHLPDPEAFLDALQTCKGRIVISTPNRSLYDPNAKLGDKPSNPYHTIEWTSEEFAELIQRKFPDREVRFLSQLHELPGRIVEGLRSDAWFTIAVIGEGELPKWPKIGFSMPTVNNAGQGIDCISAFVTYYPGEVEFAVVMNGTDEANKSAWIQFAEGANNKVHLFESDVNLGYGTGANLGLEALRNIGGFDLYGVTNDDIYPSIGCLSELAYTAQNLAALDQKPGLIGITSNQVHGRQQLNIGEYNSIPEMFALANQNLRATKSSATPWPQVRGLCFVITPDCLESVGGFDPIFGLGNFEDDDFCLRIKLAGFTTWICDGAYAFHHGSQTFSNLKVDYQANLNRNMTTFNQKWQLENHADFIQLTEKPEGVNLHVPLTTMYKPQNAVVVAGGETVDLINQATDVEFAYWVYANIAGKGPQIRKEIMQILQPAAVAAAA
jgi:GT2 family glycosyltransferase